MINIIIFLTTQRTLRNILLGKPDVSQQQTPSVRVIGRTTTAFESFPNKNNRNLKATK
ncbi:hypothetical protein NECAME_08806 [Necator americanus]|uniref:Uncharacterized protein n=1 Tax=Necator americanus TaxID=51031 RepID=W2THC6_NECAM|nr:hypothetical protein NECAME_08806 [Necator americanus]ETN81004.1 hypothetical protein NECAME_08806 [Necator americanus]